jgi:hypothetical protein
MDLIMALGFVVGCVGVILSKGVNDGLIYIAMILAIFIAYFAVVYFFGDEGKWYLLGLLVLIGLLVTRYNRKRNSS